MARRIRAREVLRLRSVNGLSQNAIARTAHVSKHSVQDVLEAARERGVSWEDVEGMSEEAAYALLFPGRGDAGPVHADPDRARVHRELARTGVTLKLLHAEYVDGCAEAGAPSMSYDRFCKRYRQYTASRNVVSRVGHKAGRNMEVDWSGPRWGRGPRDRRGQEGVPVRGLPTVQPVQLRRADARHEAGYMAAVPRARVSFLGGATPLHRPRQPQDRRHRPPQGRGAGPERGVRGARRPLRLGRDPGEGQAPHGQAERRERGPGGERKLVREHGAFGLLVINEWLLDKPDTEFRSMLLELMEPRYGTASTVFCTQFKKKDWHPRLGGGVHADAIMDGIVHNAVWVDMGEANMRLRRG